MFRQTKNIECRFEMTSCRGGLFFKPDTIDLKDDVELYNTKKRIWKKVSPIIVKYIALFYGIKPKYIAVKLKNELNDGTLDINFEISYIISQISNSNIELRLLELWEQGLTIRVNNADPFVNKKPDDVMLADLGVDEAKCIRLSRKLIRALNPNKKIVTDKKFVQEWFRVYQFEYLIK